MSWTLDSVRIFVQDLPSVDKQTIARLQPISGGTVLQVFGYEDTVLNLNAIVVGSGDVETLKAMAKDGNTHTLTGVINSGVYYVANVNAKPRNGIISQTLRSDLACDELIYDVDMELYE